MWPIGKGTVSSINSFEGSILSLVSSFIFLFFIYVCNSLKLRHYTFAISCNMVDAIMPLSKIETLKSYMPIILLYLGESGAAWISLTVG